MPNTFGSVVSASGELVPARRASLSYEIGGRAVTINVEEGDVVEAGQVLVQLDATDLEQAVAQAEAALSVAQARLAQVKAGARPEEIASAEAAVTAAQAQLAAAQANLSAAQAELARLQAGARPEEITIAEIGVARAKTYKEMDRPGAEVSEAAFNARLAAHDLDLAKAQLDLVKAGATAQELAQAQANVKAAEAQVQAAEAAVSQAQARLDLLKAGASEKDIAVSEAQVAQAQAALDAAKAALSKATLTAPFAGTIGAVYVREGEMITPGQPVIVLGDLSTLRVETTDLNEVDVARVKVGQKVDITFDALPERKLMGTVTHIAPMSAVGGGGGTDLRWGMTAFVDIIVEE